MNKQSNKIVINEFLSLINYYPYYKRTLVWYQDPLLCKQVDNIDFVYDMERLKQMYKYLKRNGELFYIKYNNRLIGDVTLLHTGEIAIVIETSYQNKHIGKQVIEQIIFRAKQKKLAQVYAMIYDFNERSIRLFLNLGFKKGENNYYYLSL